MQGTPSKRDEEGWRKKADTHKMTPEQVRAAGVEASKRPPGHHPGGVLHQRRRIPISYPAMATLAGLTLVSALVYGTFLSKDKSQADAHDAATAATNSAVATTAPEDTNIAPLQDATRQKK